MLNKKKILIFGGKREDALRGKSDIFTFNVESESIDFVKKEYHKDRDIVCFYGAVQIAEDNVVAL